MQTRKQGKDRHVSSAGEANANLIPHLKMNIDDIVERIKDLHYFTPQHSAESL